MWVYEKKLQYPVKVDSTNPALAQMILEQFGGADGELSAAIRYLSQRWSMPTGRVKALLTDVGTEEWVRRCYLYKNTVKFLLCFFYFKLFSINLIFLTANM